MPDEKLSLNVLAAAYLLMASTATLPAFAADNIQTADEFRTSKLVCAKV
ncbi:hypothetical protein [Hyphomicrobium sp. MC8b]